MRRTTGTTGPPSEPESDARRRILPDAGEDRARGRQGGAGKLRRWLGATLLAAALVTGLVWQSARSSAPPRRVTIRAVGQPVVRPAQSISGPWAVVPDVGGAIRVLLLQFGDDVGEDMLADVIVALPDARVLLATEHGRDAETILAAVRRRGGSTHAVTAFAADDGLTLWARDSFVTLASHAGSRRLVLAPVHPGMETRIADRDVPQRLARVVPHGAVVETAPLYFEGGNLVTDEVRVFAGYNALSDNSHLPYVVYPSDLTAQLRRLLGPPVVLVGSYEDPPPHDHVDMYMTPLGNNQVLVGDPSLGVQAVGRGSAEEMAEVTGRFEGRRPGEYDGRPFSMEKLVQHNRRPAVVHHFDRVADALEAAGFQVLRVPILAGGGETGLPVITYNNVLMEHRPDGRRVLMPVYGIPALDSAATRTWQGLGFAVFPVPATRVTDLEGAVRCMTHVLQRDPMAH